MIIQKNHRKANHRWIFLIFLPLETETPQGTYKHTYTVEPTTYGVNIKTWEVHPQTGIIYMFPVGQEVKVKGGTITGLRMTAAQGQTVVVNPLIEE